MGTILIVGGGHAGFYTAWRAEKQLCREARVIVISLTSVQHPREPFLAGAGPRVPPPAEATGGRVDIVMAGDAPRS